MIMNLDSHTPNLMVDLAIFDRIPANPLKHAKDEPTIGMIFCKTKQNITVEYALRDFNKPIGF